MFILLLWIKFIAIFYNSAKLVNPPNIKYAKLIQIPVDTTFYLSNYKKII